MTRHWFNVRFTPKADISPHAGNVDGSARLRRGMLAGFLV
jgi:hypothetical protein